MSKKGKLKRNFSDSEEYESEYNSESVTEEFSPHKPKKKKRICLDSESETESDFLDKDMFKNDEKLNSASNEDEPLGQIINVSKGNGKVQILASCNPSDDEPVAKSKICVKGLETYESIKNSRLEDTSSYDDEPISNIVKQKASKLKGNSKAMQHHFSDSSEDEPIAKKYQKPSENSGGQIKAQKLHSEPDDDVSEVTSDDEAICQIETSTKSKALDTSSCSSDESVKSKTSSKYSETNKKTKSLDSESDEKKSEISSDEEPLNKTTTSKTNADSSTNDSDIEPLAIKSKSLKKMMKDRKNRNQSTANEYNTISDEDDPKSKIVKEPKNIRKKEKTDSSGISSDEEPLTTKISLKQTSKLQKNGDLSSDEDEKPLRSLSKISKKQVNKKTDTSSSNGKIEHLKKYLRVAGIHVKSYDKLFEGCKSLKSKAEKLLSLLHEKGLKGRPTLEKCKKLKKKIETKKEIAELDISNIIKSEGRPKRGTGGKIVENIQNTENSPAAKKFARLRDIIDSEDSN